MSKDVYKAWNNCWRNFEDYTFFGKKILKFSEKMTRKILIDIKLPQNAHILDLGCGVGRTLSTFKSWGFNNTVGIDNSPESIKICCNRGLILNKNVFLMDATKTTFLDESFYLVFAEGVLEHFEDFNPFVKEMIRMSRKYILLLQPNHYSLMGKIINITEHLFGRNVKEYTYHAKDFIRVFEEKGCSLELLQYTPLNEVIALLFERKTYH